MYEDNAEERRNYDGYGGGTYQSEGAYPGQYGYNYRNHRPNDSLKGKVEQKYWKTKQKVIEKLGKNQDEYVIAGDAEVDARLEAFKHIQMTCMQLMVAVETYQNRIFGLSQDENEMGRFLRDQGSQDKTKAGKMMIAVGKAQSYAAQQRLSLRVPLVRLYQEIETFRYRAVSDTRVTVQRMETSRSEYRAGMLWMADVSKELDPDVNRRLDRFRDVQAQVKSNKKQFDKLKYDVLQKIDLLSASRCNLLSATLAAYQTTMLQFLEQTAKSYQTVAEQFKGHPSYQFQVLKHMIPNNGVADSDEEEMGEQDRGSRKEAAGMESGKEAQEQQGVARRATDHDDDDSKLISFDMSPTDDEKTNDDVKKSMGTRPHHPKTSADDDDDLLGMMDDVKSATSPGFGDYEASSGSKDAETEKKEFEELLNNFKQPVSTYGKDGNAAKAGNADLLLSDDLLCGMGDQHSSSRAAGNGASAARSVDDLLFGSAFHQSSAPANEMDVLNDILSATSLGESAMENDNEASFSKQWQSMFGSDGASAGASMATPSTQAMPDNVETTTQSSGLYMPSFLMDQMRKVDPVAAEKGVPSHAGASAAKKGTPTTRRKATDQAGKKQQDKSAWFNLFSDLDPLSNPDAIGKDKSCDEERSC